MLLNEIKKSENKKLELKETLPSSEKIAKTVIAFANTAGGKFVIGVDGVMNIRSELRNKVVANLFRELKYIESWGSGIEKIKKLCKKSEVKFELKEEPSFVSVVFYRKTIENGEKVPDTDDLSLEEQKILKFLQNNEKIYVKDVENILNLKTTQSKEILYKLVKKGILQKIGKTKGRYYILKEN